MQTTDTTYFNHHNLGAHPEKYFNVAIATVHILADVVSEQGQEDHSHTFQVYTIIPISWQSH